MERGGGGEGAGCEGPRLLPGILGLVDALTESSVAAVLISVDEKIRYANRAASALTGYAREELLGMDAWLPAHPEHRDAERERGRAREKRRTSPARYEMKLLTKQGEVRFADVSATSVEFEGRPAGMVTLLDVSDARRADSEAREANRRLFDLLEGAPVVALLLDAAGRVTYANPHLLGVLGREEEEVVGRRWLDSFVPPEVRERLTRSFTRMVSTGVASPPDESEILVGDGGRRRITWSATVLRDPLGGVAGAAFVGEDATERRLAAEKLQRAAFYDPLTGLPNRTLFLDQVTRSLSRARRRTRSPMAVLYLDLDRFKIVNDSLGHAAGNRLLVEAARTLAEAVRPGDTLARLEGDEFSILVEDLPHPAEALRLAERMQRALAAPLSVEGREVFVTACIGVVLSTGDASAEELVRDAENALHHAKALGPGRCRVFDETMHGQATRVLELEADLRRAVERRELVVHYQPIVALETGRIAGFEALVRWKHPTRGLLSPKDFIHLAEETGLILDIGHDVLTAACREAAAWPEEGPAGAPRVGVNLSGRQLDEPDLVKRVAAVLEETGLPARRLCLEVTESVLFEDPRRAVELLSGLRDLGAEIAIDDFGTGYSSLSYLLELPAATLKIDQSFVAVLCRGGRQADFVRSIIALARSLDLSVVAEGIEAGEQLLSLQALRCDFGQGFLFAPPLSVEGVRAMLGGRLTL